MESVNHNLAAVRDVLPRSSIDTLLLPYLRAGTEDEAEQSLAQIISEQVEPVAWEVTKRRLRLIGAARDDDIAQAEDICSDVIVHLLTRLRKLRDNPHDEAIGDLRAFVAVVATHACYSYLRRKHPQRHILKSKMRYLLTRQSGFALWENGAGELVAGFAVWRVSDEQANVEKLEALILQPFACVPAELLNREAQRTRPADLLAAIFDYLGGAVVLDELVSVVARLWGIEDRQDSDEETLARIEDTRADASAELEAQEHLQRLWDEIKQLPVRQRAALLLNLKEEQGRGCLMLFSLMGIATMRQIAGALEMPAEQLAALWSQLPLDDACIAARLGLTRQQVINLRKSARARLARRMKVF